MPKIKYADTVYYRGGRLIIVCAVTTNNAMVGREFLDSIGPPDWGKLDRIICRLADKGKIFNKEQFRPVGDSLFEIKGGAKRMVGYFLPGHFVITHGFEKRGGGKSANRFPGNQRKRALEIKSQFEPIFKKMKKG